MSHLTHRQVQLVPERYRRALVAAVVTAVLAAIVVTLAVTASDGASTNSHAEPGEVPALRSDGGPEESMRGPVSTPQPADGGAALRNDGGPEESTRLR